MRKISGYHHPSQTNEAAFASAVDEITAATQRLLGALATDVSPKDRDAEAAKARTRFERSRR